MLPIVFASVQSIHPKYTSNIHDFAILVHMLSLYSSYTSVLHEEGKKGRGASNIRVVRDEQLGYLSIFVLCIHDALGR